MGAPLVIAARFTSTVEADIACSALRAAGIEATIFDNLTPGFVSLSTGGPEGRRLMVPEDQLDAALEILTAARTVEVKREKTPEERVKEAAPLLLMGGLVLGVPIAILLGQIVGHLFR